MKDNYQQIVLFQPLLSTISSFNQNRDIVNHFGLLEVADTNNTKHFYFGKLHNPLVAPHCLNIRIARELINQLTKKDDFVAVRGYLLLRPRLEANQIQVELQINQLGPASREQTQQLLDYQLAYQQLIDYSARRGKRKLARRSKLKLLVICPYSQTAITDLITSLGSWPQLNLHSLCVAFNDKEQIQQALHTVIEQQRQWDGVILIRGGGDNQEFAIFDQVDTAELWATIKIFKLTALGHSNYTETLLDQIADVSLATPTSAGYYLRQHLLTTKNRQQLWRRLFWRSLPWLILLGGGYWYWRHF